MVAFADKLPGTLVAAVRYFTEERAYSYIKGIKWADGPCCPVCGSVNVGEIKSRARFQCREKGCRKQFSLLTGTIFEASHLKLEQWMAAIWMIANCRNGVSSCEIARAIGCKQQSAWHLLHRARVLFEQETAEPMSGIVECDEAYVGGLVKWMHWDQRERALAREDAHKGKAIVFGMIERGSGRVRAQVIPAATTKHAQELIRENIEPGSELNTDNSRIYDWAQGEYERRKVNHGMGEYVRDGVTTNALEGFFNCLRRGLKGTYIATRHDHLPAYVDEQVWRFNVRKLGEWERFDKAMRKIVGKRLTYTELTDGAVR